MNREIFRMIAKENGVSVIDVKKDIHEAIKVAFENPNAEAQKIPCKGNIPTPDEMVAYIVDSILAGGQ